MSSDRIFQAQTYAIQKHIFAVRNELKAGWSEHIYHQALRHSLLDEGIPVQSKPRRPMIHRGVEVHVFEPDLIVSDEIILELKVLPHASEFAGEHTAQIIHYLKFFEKHLGILINFAPARVLTKRVVWDEPSLNIDEDLGHIESFLSTPDRTILQDIRESLFALAEEYGLGYSDLIYRNLVIADLRYRSLPCRTEIVVPAKWRQNVIGHHPTQYLLVADTVLVHVCALPKRPSTYEFTSMKTYLHNLGLRYGLLINFGYHQLQLHGVTGD